MLTLATIQEAQTRIAPFIWATPVLRSLILDQIARQALFFKCENLQLGGAFKARGAFNAVYSLSSSAAARGVVTHSSGNHAGALGLAARSRGIPATIVMPEDVALPKLNNVRRTGAEMILCQPTLEAREAAADEVIARTGATMIHPYNDYSVMAGQGTVALEFMEEIPDLDLILVPVSGGGLLAGTVVAAKATRRELRVIAVEPAGAADAWESFNGDKLIPVNNPNTIADGLRASLGSLTYPFLRDQVDDVVTVSEEGIVNAMRQLWDELNIIVEPSGAVAWAAIREGRIPLKGKTGIVLTGGNVDLDRLPWAGRKRSD